MGFGAFAGGFAKGLDNSMEIGMKYSKLKSDTARAAREEEQYQMKKDQDAKEAQYQSDVKAAGSAEASAVDGVTVGSQQDAQLAAQQGDLGMNRKRTTSERLSKIADVQLGAGKISESVATKDAARKEDIDASRKAIIQDSSLDAFGKAKALGALDMEYGTGYAAKFMSNKDMMGRLKKEGAFDAYQILKEGNGSPESVSEAVKKYNEIGDNKVDANVPLVAEKRKSKVSGDEYTVYTGKHTNGSPFVLDPVDIGYIGGGYEKWEQDQKADGDRKDKAAKSDRDERRLKVDEKKADAMVGLYGARAAAAGSGGGGGSPKAVQTLEWKASAYKGIGIEPGLAKAIAANSQFATSPQAVQKQAQFIIKSSMDPAGQPTKTMDQAMKEAEQSMLSAQRIAVNTMSTPGQGSPQPAAAAQPVTPRAEYDKLPAGARYIGPDGKRYIKGK